MLRAVFPPDRFAADLSLGLAGGTDNKDWRRRPPDGVVGVTGVTAGFEGDVGVAAGVAGVVGVTGVAAGFEGTGFEGLVGVTTGAAGDGFVGDDPDAGEGVGFEAGWVAGFVAAAVVGDAYPASFFASVGFVADAFVSVFLVESSFVVGFVAFVVLSDFLVVAGVVLLGVVFVFGESLSLIVEPSFFLTSYFG